VLSAPDQDHAANQESDANQARQINRVLGKPHPSEVINPAGHQFSLNCNAYVESDFGCFLRRNIVIPNSLRLFLQGITRLYVQ
jgi:hypothetical protein